MVKAITNKRKLRIFQISLLILFLAFLYFLLKAKDYTKEYTVNDVLITESYRKDSDSYYFTFTYNDITFDYLYESNYKQKRNFIIDLTIKEGEGDYCLIPSGDALEFIPLCASGDNIIHYTKVNDNLKAQIPQEYFSNEKEINDTYNSLNIYNRDYTYLLWKYNGFYYINATETQEIDLFSEEEYNVTLIGYTADYLLLADYDQNYTFDKIYRISFKNGSLKEYSLDYDIYFDSSIMGYVGNKLYLIDNNESVMYEFNAQNGELEKINSRLLIDGNWEEVGIKSLINQKRSFTYKTNYEYTLSDHTLTLSYKSAIKTIIDEDVTSIVRIKDNLVFYLKTDTLYVFDPLKGSTRLLSYFEWNFNNENMIYVD